MVDTSGEADIRELIFNPHYWQKTRHGLFPGRVRMPRNGTGA